MSIKALEIKSILTHGFPFNHMLKTVYSLYAMY